VNKPWPASDDLVAGVQAALMTDLPDFEKLVPVAFDRGIVLPKEVFGVDDNKPQVWSNPDVYGREKSESRCLIQ
jgi:hypothetical protein